MKYVARVLITAAIVFAAGAGAVLAVQPDEVLDDPALEARAREISKDLRCLVCQNQSIDDSDADLARDLRLIVRQRLAAGDSNEEVVQYLVDRYGDYVLLDPPVKPVTYLLWYGPPAILLIAVIGLAFGMRRRRTASDRPRLSDEEEKRVSELLSGGPGS